MTSVSVQMRWSLRDTMIVSTTAQPNWARQCIIAVALCFVISESRTIVRGLTADEAISSEFLAKNTEILSKQRSGVYPVTNGWTFSPVGVPFLVGVPVNVLACRLQLPQYLDSPKFIRVRKEEWIPDSNYKKKKTKRRTYVRTDDNQRGRMGCFDNDVFRKCLHVFSSIEDKDIKNEKEII
ncbi:hypothetical protein ANCCEY_10305 [Ancylostoma ceylanicum]|uniref:Uncharacterized protein n=1 Tax=Ancylostoma ceylanicum TaxID=53326 RepID=A0A0D6LHE8_9BILA|nr:hypothetical protein ANCCEY_10305 [Ancylostoma ceylanicum]